VVRTLDTVADTVPTVDADNVSLGVDDEIEVTDPDAEMTADTVLTLDPDSVSLGVDDEIEVTDPDAEAEATADTVPTLDADSVSLGVDDGIEVTERDAEEKGDAVPAFVIDAQGEAELTFEDMVDAVLRRVGVQSVVPDFITLSLDVCREEPDFLVDTEAERLP